MSLPWPLCEDLRTAYRSQFSNSCQVEGSNSGHQSRQQTSLETELSL